MPNRRVSSIVVLSSVLGAGLLVAVVSLWKTHSQPVPSGSPKEQELNTMLIEPAVFQEMLQSPWLRILDTRPESEFATLHIPRAVRVDVKGWQDQGKKENGFRDAKAWSEKVGQLGINNDTHVVIYGNNLPDTARIWWTLKYLGIEKVSILDGGWELWVKDKRPTDADSYSVLPSVFTPRFQSDRLEEIDSLKELVQKREATVVDARTVDEFTGNDVRGKRGGHIPGARHLEWKELLAADGRFKSADQLRELFRQRGIQPDQTAVTC